MLCKFRAVQASCTGTPTVSFWARLHRQVYMGSSEKFGIHIHSSDNTISSISSLLSAVRPQFCVAYVKTVTDRSPFSLVSLPNLCHTQRLYSRPNFLSPVTSFWLENSTQTLTSLCFSDDRKSQVLMPTLTVFCHGSYSLRWSLVIWSSLSGPSVPSLELGLTILSGRSNHFTLMVKSGQILGYY